MSKDRFSFYKEYPKSCDIKDFWGQVKRTVNGKPVSQAQIDMIVNAVINELDLRPNDRLLDICCGNGALSTLLFDQCEGGLGVDFSEYLISIAKKYFSHRPTHEYIFVDAVDFCCTPSKPELFTKALCYGSFSYIEEERAELLLQNLNKNFPNLSRVFIGNTPDKALVNEFFAKDSYDQSSISDPSSAIGIWRTSSDFASLANRCGWKAQIKKMPAAYYASHYRYDVILIK